MTQEQKCDYFKMAASFCNFGFQPDQIEMLVGLYELVLKKEGEANLQDLIEVKYTVIEKYKKIELDKLKNKYEPKIKSEPHD